MVKTVDFTLCVFYHNEKKKKSTASGLHNLQAVWL